MRRAATALALTLTLGGCGGSARTPAPSGSRVFAGQCAVCHSLVGNESLHTQGGDLRGYRFSRQTLTSFTREMPTRRRLTAPELRAVVDYVLRAEQAAH